MYSHLKALEKGSSMVLVLLESMEKLLRYRLLFSTEKHLVKYFAFYRPIVRDEI
jgi:hypothetical protein